MTEQETTRVFQKLDALENKLGNHVEECAKDKTVLHARIDKLEAAVKALDAKFSAALQTLGATVKEFGTRLNLLEQQGAATRVRLNLLLGIASAAAAVIIADTARGWLAALGWLP